MDNHLGRALYVYEIKLFSDREGETSFDFLSTSDNIRALLYNSSSEGEFADDAWLRRISDYDGLSIRKKCVVNDALIDKNCLTHLVEGNREDVKKILGELKEPETPEHQDIPF